MTTMYLLIDFDIRKKRFGLSGVSKKADISQSQW